MCRAVFAVQRLAMLRLILARALATGLWECVRYGTLGMRLHGLSRTSIFIGRVRRAGHADSGPDAFKLLV